MKVGRLLLGMLAGNVVGASICRLAIWLVSLIDEARFVVAYPSLFAVPFSIGLVAAWFWRPLNLRIGELLLHSLVCALIGLGGAWVAMREGHICLLMAAPILYAGVFAGAFVGRIWLRKDRDRLIFCLAPLLALGVSAEPALRASHTGVVTDEILINAPPATVWQHVLAFREIPDVPDYWLFRIGLPYPTETTNAGDFVGADRACKFSGGAIFKEKVAEFVPEQKLTFDIIEMPPDPELIGHLDAHRGQFELRDNGDGTTTLIGRTWYSLHVRPAWYFDWWTHDIFRAVHLRVMRHVQQLAERRR